MPETILYGTIFDEGSILSLKDLSRLCAVDERHIVELVEEGVIQVADDQGSGWRFTGAAVRRTRLALKLTRELEVDLAGVALAIELMEEIRRLRRELQRLENAREDQ